MIHQNGFIRYFTEEKKKMIEILQNIIINDLFKNCDQDEKFEKEKHKLALYCFTDEVLFISSTIKVL